jgi:hypothetical protein
VVAVNDITEAQMLAHLLAFGRLRRAMAFAKDSLIPRGTPCEFGAALTRACGTLVDESPPCPAGRLVHRDGRAP